MPRPTAAGVFGMVRTMATSAPDAFEETDIAPGSDRQDNGVGYQTPGIGGDDIVHPLRLNGKYHDVGRETGIEVSGGGYDRH